MPIKPPSRQLKFIGFRPTGDIGAWTVYTTKRNFVVWFLKSPPKKKRSRAQVQQWIRFAQAAQAWNNLSKGAQNAWMLGARGAHLYISGYNLFLTYQLKRDVAALRTISRMSRVELPPT